MDGIVLPAVLGMVCCACLSACDGNNTASDGPTADWPLIGGSTAGQRVAKGPEKLHELLGDAIVAYRLRD